MPATPSGVAASAYSGGSDVCHVSLAGRFVLNGRNLGSQRGTPSAPLKWGKIAGGTLRQSAFSTGYGGTWWLKVTTLQGARRLASYW